MNEFSNSLPILSARHVYSARDLYVAAARNRDAVFGARHYQRRLRHQGQHAPKHALATQLHALQVLPNVVALATAPRRAKHERDLGMPRRTRQDFYHQLQRRRVHGRQHGECRDREGPLRKGPQLVKTT